MRVKLNDLIEAVNRVGIRNVSLLSRLTGMPKETIRYALKHRFPELGLSVGLQVDYDRLGLERTFVVLEFAPGAFDHATELLDRLADVAFLTYRAREIFRPPCIATFGVPVALREKFDLFLKRMVKERILLRFRVERIEWTRHLALIGKYYDFDNRKWSVDWKRLDSLQEPPPAPPSAVEPSPYPDVDVTDLLLIKELELHSWRNVTDIARKLGMNERTARWHYARHVSPMIASHYVRIVAASLEELRRLIGLVFEFRHLSSEQLALARRVFNNLPFTWNENGRRDGYYLAVLTVPSEHLVESLKFLNSHLQKEIPSWETYSLDLTSSCWYTIPYQNFREGAGWFFDEEKVFESILSVKKAVKKR
ncbi:MAG: hypothetical protein HYU39_08880 [Thaumarchaeota archaeon]|nr:hypothetical protein [Nitrososphaerota archaeon]